MKKEELEKLKELANSNNIPHNFICNDPTQKDQIDYWNATNPTKILELIESYERSLKLVKACEMTLSHALALDYLGEGSTMGMALGVVKECEEFLRSIE